MVQHDQLNVCVVLGHSGCLHVIPSVEGRKHTEAEYVNLGETITLQCQNSGSSTSLWRRNDYFISGGLDINPNAYGHDRLRITGDSMKGEYDLEISNITEEDLGIYSCEIVINEVAIQTKVTLRFQSYNNATRVQDDFTTKDKILTTPIIESVTDNTSPTDTQNTTKRSYYTTVSGTAITTDMQTQRLTDIKPSTTIYNEAIDANRHETGFSSNEKLVYYGLLAGGLVLVLCLSVTCNICIIHKYKTGQLNLQLNKTVNANANNTFKDTEDHSSNYESICESEMIQNVSKLHSEMSVVAVHPQRNKSDHNSPTSERSYLEVIADAIYINPSLHSKGNSESDSTHKVSSPEYGEASHKDQNSSDLDSYTEEFGRKDLTNSKFSVNVSSRNIDASDNFLARCMDETRNEPLNRHDEVYLYCKPSKEDSLSMVNFAELSESGSPTDESDQHIVLQNREEKINPYENLKRTDKDDVHDYNTCIVPPRY
ncbi:Hypothetical predicted protein [Mytilus galloprovincialis]|uniref:Ig-like domain-containing protein n=1 Tax=Mytilus galloprovincialis TaxID=29158 RepID=A0A8B6GW44_MYTGA|nr:Hypothetical predicted protein [Mytilus galloprovincialis]